MFYREVIRALSQAEIRYLVVGGVAVNLHGIPRMTYDLDLMISLDVTNVRSAVDVMQKLGFVPRLPVRAEDFESEELRMQWKNEKHMLVFSFIKSNKEFETVDFFIDNPMNFDECYERRQILNPGGIPISTISVEDLIALKKLGGRKQDQSDIEALEKLGGLYGE